MGHAASRTIPRTGSHRSNFVRDNFGDAGDIAGALVVQSIYNARRAPAFRITGIVLLATRTTWGRRSSMLPIVRSLILVESLSTHGITPLRTHLSLHRTLPSNNYHREFRDNTLFQHSGERDSQLKYEVLLCNLTLMNTCVSWMYNILFIIFIYLFMTRIAQDSK